MISTPIVVAPLMVAVSFMLSSVGVAEPYPHRPVRIIVAYPPGGGTDILARTLAQKFSEQLGQTFVVDNRPGANGNIGTALAAAEPANGYTLLLGTSNLTVNPSFYPKLPYDTLKDFAPISLVTISPNLLVVNATLAITSVKELIDYAKSRPDALNFASNGSGASSHLSAELFKTMTGTRMLHVPFKGGGPALTALLSGEVQLMFGNPLALMPAVKSGKLRALAVTTAKRSGAFADIPTVAEAGLPGYDVSPWYGLLAPARTPKDIVDLLSRQTVKALQLPDVRATLERNGADPAGSTPEELTAFIKDELVKWPKVIKASGARLD